MTSVTSCRAVPRFLLPQFSWTSSHQAATQQRPIFRIAYSLRYSAPQPRPSSIRHIHITGSAVRRQQNQCKQKQNRAFIGSLYQPPWQTLKQSPTHNTSVLRAFSSTPSFLRDHHFDTLKFVQRLQDEGLSEEQAISLMRVLSDVIEESIQNLTRTMVLREDALKTSYTQKVDFSALRTELLSLDSSEAALTRASHERLANELAKLSSRLRDEIQRTQASVRLDLNLEKGRIREEANVQELKIKETETRIEQEVAGLRERVEGVKFSTLQWLMGVCTGTAALILGAWRLLM